MPSPLCIERSTVVNGATVTFAIIGDTSLRRPIMYHHGFPGTRHEALIAAKSAAALGASLVSIDRPGLGGSTFTPKRTLLDWPPIVEGVARQLGLSSFDIIGVSGGAPYALVTAHALRTRVRRMAIVSGMGDIASHPKLLHGMARGNRALLSVALRAPSLARLIIHAIALLWKCSPSLALFWFKQEMAHCDRTRLASDGTQVFLSNIIQEALQQGARGALGEFDILAKQWGFDASEVTAPTSIWHGAADSYVPPTMAVHLAGRLPNASCHIVEGAGHLLVLECIGNVIDSLLTSGES